MMTVTGIPGKEKWTQAHHQLSLALEKEIELMRELLAVLHEEEFSLLMRDERRWKKVMRDHSDLIVQLQKQRTKRMNVTTDLTKLAVKLTKSTLLPPEEESSCAVLSKLDQLVALIDRINLQNSRNDVLFEQTKHDPNPPLQCAYPHPVTARRKTIVATYTKSA